MIPELFQKNGRLLRLQQLEARVFHFVAPCVHAETSRERRVHVQRLMCDLFLEGLRKALEMPDVRQSMRHAHRQEPRVIHESVEDGIEIFGARINVEAAQTEHAVHERAFLVRQRSFFEKSFSFRMDEQVVEDRCAEEGGIVAQFPECRRHFESMHGVRISAASLVVGQIRFSKSHHLAKLPAACPRHALVEAGGCHAVAA